MNSVTFICGQNGLCWFWVCLSFTDWNDISVIQFLWCGNKGKCFLKNRWNTNLCRQQEQKALICRADGIWSSTEVQSCCSWYWNIAHNVIAIAAICFLHFYSVLIELDNPAFRKKKKELMAHLMNWLSAACLSYNGQKCGTKNRNGVGGNKVSLTGTMIITEKW